MIHLTQRATIFRGLNMEERRVHERLTVVEQWVDKHEQRHNEFEKALRHNTELTKTIAANTTELVDMVKGAKKLHAFIEWLAPVFIILAALATILAYWVG